MGLDVADEGKDENCAILRFGGYVDRALTWSGVDPTETARRARDIFRANRVLYVNVDGIGVGASVAPDLNKRYHAKAYKIMVSWAPTQEAEEGRFGILRDEMLWAVREWLRTDRGAMLPPDEKLEEELLCLQYWTDSRGRLKISDRDQIAKAVNRSADRLMALALTFVSGAGGKSKKLSRFTYITRG